MFLLWRLLFDLVISFWFYILLQATLGAIWSLSSEALVRNLFLYNMHLARVQRCWPICFIFPESWLLNEWGLFHQPSRNRGRRLAMHSIFYLSKHFNKRFFENTKDENPLEERIVKLHLFFFVFFVSDFETFHNDLDTCVDIGHKLFLNEQLSKLHYWNLYVSKVLTIGTARVPLINYVYFFWQSWHSVYFWQR